MCFFYLSLVFFAALIYPYLLYPAMLLFIRKQPFRPNSDDSAANPTVAFLFCAYNEELALPAKINNISDIKALWPDIEVRAYTDCCTDNSVALLRQAEDVVIVHEGLIRTGKVEGMRRLVGATKAEILIFTDANVIVEPESIGRLVAYFADPDIGMVAGTLHYTNPDDSASARTNSAYWRLEELIKRLESETGSTMGADGSLFSMRSSSYPVIPAELIDDMIASMNPLFDGYRIVSAPDVHAFETAVISSREEFKRKRRIACGAFNTHRYLWPRLRTMSLLNRFKYFSHKYLRWFSAVFLVLWAVFAIAAIASLGHVQVAVVAAGSGLAALLIGRQFDVPIVSPLTEVVLGMLATGLGVLEAITGRSYQTWTPPARG
jgi:cellulose synthase/poly-beta-1,6-N-acetylglucosamine synthase-like glycosyltransferase